MGEDFWVLFCNSSESFTEFGNECSSGFLNIINPESCTNNILVIAADILLLFMLLCMQILSKTDIALSQSHTFSAVSIVSASFNVGLALAYLGFGIWTIVEKENTDETVLPLHGWLVLLFHGFTWLVLGLIISLKKPHPPQSVKTKSCSVLAFLMAFFIAFFLCSSSVWEAFADQAVSVKIVLNILSFPGSMLVLLCRFQGKNYANGDPEIHDDASYTLLPGAESDIRGEVDSNDNVTPFAKAGLFSTMTFSWLNPLMKKGKQKIIENKDIPQLQEPDRARTLFLIFMEELNKRKERGSSNKPSILSIIFFCQRKAILISGFFALIKILAMTSSPLFLMCFIQVVEGCWYYCFGIPTSNVPLCLCFIFLING